MSRSRQHLDLDNVLIPILYPVPILVRFQQMSLSRSRLCLDLDSI